MTMQHSAPAEKGAGAFSRVQFGVPNKSINSRAFGVISSQQNSLRLHPELKAGHRAQRSYANAARLLLFVDPATPWWSDGMWEPIL